MDELLSERKFHRDLREQIRDAIDSIVSNISEGFEQPTDRAFAKYLFDAKASTAEARQRLWMAAQRKFITAEEYQKQNDLGDQVARMTVGLIKYLLRSGRRDRGLGPPGDNPSFPERKPRLRNPAKRQPPTGRRDTAGRTPPAVPRSERPDAHIGRADAQSVPADADTAPSDVHTAPTDDPTDD